MSSHSRHEEHACPHEMVAYCRPCDATYCKDCNREWRKPESCSLNHWPTYVQPTWRPQPYWQYAGTTTVSGQPTQFTTALNSSLAHKDH